MEYYFKNSYKSETHNLALVVKNVGFQNCTPGYRWGEGVRDHFLLHYVVRGCGSYSVSGKVYTVKAGQVFLARPYTLISYEADMKNPWEYYWLGFSGPEAERLLEKSGFDEQTPVISIDYGEEFCRYVMDIYDARGQSPGSRARMLGYAYLLLARLNDNTAADDDESMVSMAAEYMKNNFAGRVTVTEVASYVGVSRSWLYRGFQRRFGCSPNEYLQELRMSYAKKLLTETELRSSQVAYSVGFPDALYFSKAFSKAVGISPSRYREQGRKHDR